MFKNLTDFRFKRTAAQAVGFYLVYLVLGLAIGGSTSGLFNIIANFFGLTVSYKIGLSIGSFTAIIFSALLTITIIRANKLFSYGPIILGFLAVLITIFTGLVLGLIIVAYLTTTGNPSVSEEAAAPPTPPYNIL